MNAILYNWRKLTIALAGLVLTKETYVDCGGLKPTI